MKRRIFNIVSGILIFLGASAVLYPKFAEWGYKKQNTELVDLVWNRMDKNYVDDTLGLSRDEEADVYSRMDVESMDVLISAFQELKLMNETTPVDDSMTDSMTLEEKAQELIERDISYGMVEIPALEVCYAVVKGTAPEDMKISIGHLNGSAHFGQFGNCILAGHRGGKYGIFFKYLDQLKEGSKVIVTNMQKEVFTYKVYEQVVIDVDEVEKILPIAEEKQLTLVTCEAEGDKRLLVRCRMEETK